jgi:hypothetical protein
MKLKNNNLMDCPWIKKWYCEIKKYIYHFIPYSKIFKNSNKKWHGSNVKEIEIEGDAMKFYKKV